MIALAANSDQFPAPGARAMAVASQAVGLLVFLVGIGMIALVFSWTYRVFATVDEQVAHVKPATPAPAPVVSGGKEAPKVSSSGAPSPAGARPPTAAPPSIIASPRETTIMQVSAALLLKFVGLFVLGWIASLVAAKGAALATGRHISG